MASCTINPRVDKPVGGTTLGYQKTIPPGLLAESHIYLNPGQRPGVLNMQEGNRFIRGPGYWEKIVSNGRVVR
ncbi:MAG: hypothetical protein JW798_15675 [Prolixibacteraceae bacterium]|nr:hypothetical protein [Prolixibacteraceae bacterium]